MTGTDTILDKQHHDVLERAVRNVLATRLTLETCAQIVDGLPLASVAFDQYNYRVTRLNPSHPVSEHTSLCQGAEEAARQFLSGFAINMLEFDDKLLRFFQSAAPGHRSFYCRLIELVAVAVHKLAVLLFKQGHRIHDKLPWKKAFTIDRVTSWQSKEDRKRGFAPPGPTLFAHFSYNASDQYPDGVADVVGYWAENRILGGVIVFDRHEAWDDERSPEPNAWLHSDRDGVTIRLCQLLDEQQRDLVDFLLSESPAAACPCPLLPSDKNLTRLDPDDATEDDVYRDIWERKPPNIRPGRGNGVGGCVPSSLDYPEEESEEESYIDRRRPEQPSLLEYLYGGRSIN
ncbi:hypothetical protein C8A03DRAFT_38834 [Achaetomium macrosporum]|uniref:Uncharacterized protein n=1 Tax=Achaetomium macrosporum TaxID=79813 RepID=A0AAN7C1Q4_9PEZI|nr:hypothetical protein C8A03DRAFT_38834 [Achaetomium macrosporum]